MTKQASLRSRMEQNARAYNNTLTPEFLKTASQRKLLAFCHPSDRMDFIKEITGKRDTHLIETVDNDNL